MGLHVDGEKYKRGGGSGAQSRVGTAKATGGGGKQRRSEALGRCYPLTLMV